jgi:hypothetical protein
MNRFGIWIPAVVAVAFAVAMFAWPLLAQQPVAPDRPVPGLEVRHPERWSLESPFPVLTIAQ